MTLMTQAAFAARRGVGKSAVSNWKKAGLVVFAEGGDGKMYVDAERTEARLNSRLDPMRGRPSTAPVDAPELPIEVDAAEGGPVKATSVHGARAELLAEQLSGLRMKNAREAGELVLLAEAEQRLTAIGRMARDRVSAELRSVAERLAVTNTPREIMAVLDEATTKAFAAVAKAIAGGALDDDEDEEEDDEIEEAA